MGIEQKHKTVIEQLITKAGNAGDSQDAMRFAQAALNVMNAVFPLNYPPQLIQPGEPAEQSH